MHINIYTYIYQFIRYDHQERLTAEEAMLHPYFANIRQAELSFK